MKIRYLLIISLLFSLSLAAGFYLNLNLSELAANAAPTGLVDKPALSQQALSSAEVDRRPAQRAVAEATTLYRDDYFAYQVRYPASWQHLRLAPNVNSFVSPDGGTYVTVEAVGPLPADGLASFVERSLHNQQVIARQGLTIHGAAAERVLRLDEAGQVTTFYVDTGQTGLVIEGAGQQASIEQIARSLNAPQEVTRY